MLIILGECLEFCFLVVCGGFFVCLGGGGGGWWFCLFVFSNTTQYLFL